MMEITQLNDALAAKLRFECKGQISIEDLYDLSKDELDDLFKKYNKMYTGEGLMEGKKEDDILKLKLDVIKMVFNYKEEQERKNAEELKNKQIKDRLLKALEDKEIQSLHEMSKEDLKKMLNDF